MKYTYKLGNIKLTPEMGEAVEKARPEGLNKQAMVREALELWLAAKTGSGYPVVLTIGTFRVMEPARDWIGAEDDRITETGELLVAPAGAQETLPAEATRFEEVEWTPREPPDYVIWWIPEGARRAVSRITLPNVRDEDGEVIETPPRYLTDHIEDVFQIRSSPRGNIFNAHKFPDVDLPDVERLQGRRPFAKFIWQESCAGLVVRGEDRNFLTDAPGFQSTLDLRQVTE